MYTLKTHEQAYVVERSQELSPRGPQRDNSALEARLTIVRTAEPLLIELLNKISDDKPIVQRRLFQRKGTHKILLRLLRSMPADFQETAAPLCYTTLAGLCDRCPVSLCATPR